MRIILLLTLVLSAATMPVAAQETDRPASPSSTEEEVRRLEREWLDAYEKYDAEAMGRIVADDFAITFPNGRIQTKAQIMAMLKRPRREGAPTTRFRTDEVQARSYGDTVILMGKVIEQSEREGKATTEASRYTDTYVKREGRWQVVASHLSNVPAAKAEQK
ncbi:MAG: nuclear transport factor 2 family protein [Verrucomicrobiota bacterium]|nr:nuclear transport factor 2 family protein [Verrucomicrobiota bacterium]